MAIFDYQTLLNTQCLYCQGKDINFGWIGFYKSTYLVILKCNFCGTLFVKNRGKIFDTIKRDTEWRLSLNKNKKNLTQLIKQKLIYEETIYLINQIISKLINDFKKPLYTFFCLAPLFRN